MKIQYEKMLLDIIENYNELSDLSKKLVTENFKLKYYVKDSFITKEEQFDESEYFLLEGILQRCNYTNDGESVTTGFYMAGTVLTPNFARTINGRSIFSIQAIADSELAEISVKLLDELRNKYEDLRIFGKKVVEDELKKSLSEDIAFRAHTAKDRLLSLRINYPNLENLVPHTLIASYLGITPVSFSRLRNELAKG